jgi:hypothetical protein
MVCHALQHAELVALSRLSDVMHRPMITATPPRRDHLAPFRITLTHLWRHHRVPNLTEPQTFNELVHHRKLHGRDPRMPALADKVRVKAFVADRIGSEWLIPTLWHGTELPDCPQWPTPFVLKSRHGCNQISFVRAGSPPDWNALARRCRNWMRTDYGEWLDEWAYTQIPRGLLVEPMIGNGTTLPLDYKFFVFGGRVEYIQVHIGRGARHRWVVMDRNWHRRSSATADSDPAPPTTLSRMIIAAEALSHGIEFVRVDMYEVEDRPLFGEMTFYPGSGLDRFDPVSLDRELGSLWLVALQQTTTVTKPSGPHAVTQDYCHAAE